jgi:hypothetical protein
MPVPVNDPQVLLVKQLFDAPPTEMDFALHYHAADAAGNSIDQRASLCGFSFFEEVSGLDPDSEAGIDLWSDLDENRPPDAGRRYGLTYDDYLDVLYNYRQPGSSPGMPPKPGHINYIRLFLFDAVTTRNYPFQFDEATGKYNLHVIDKDYMTRLSEFVGKARSRGIVVCISFVANQAIKSDGWMAGPFFYMNNNNGFEHFTNGLSSFCNITQPSAADIGYDPNGKWSTGEKLYFIEHQLIKRVVEATKGFWNVIYEICNEPITDMVNVREWHKTVAGWVNESLPPAPSSRWRLISITGVGALLDDLAADLRGMVDIISLHGSQWTNDTTDATNLCKGTAIPSTQTIADWCQAEITRFRGQGYALIFDADSAYWAQRAPTDYVQETLSRHGTFNYRWPDDMLTEVVLNDPRKPPPPGDPRYGNYYCTPSSNTLGLNQRLKLITQAPYFGDTVTPLPLAPLPVTSPLTVSYEAGALKLSFDRPRPAANQQVPDVAPEGYRIYYGATAATVGQGAEFLPPSRYFQVADPEHPHFSLPIPQSTYPRELYVAVAACNGTLIGEHSGVAHVTIPPGVLGATFDHALQLPFGGQIPDRTFSGSIIFKNTGTAVWKKQTPLPKGTATCGLYLLSQEVVTEAGRFFFPLSQDYVFPGQNVLFQLTNVRLPYSRQTLHFHIGMAFYIAGDDGSRSYGNFGTVYDHLPDGTPAQVLVLNPKRHASVALNQDGIWPLPGKTVVEMTKLPVASEASSHDVVSCTTTSTAAPGTIIRWALQLRMDSSQKNQTTCAVAVWHTSPTANQVGVNLRVARLDGKDIDMPPHPSTLIGSFGNLAAKTSRALSLTRFQSLYSITTAASQTPIPSGPSEFVSWEEMLTAASPPVKQLLVTNSSDVAVTATTWSNEVWENLPAGQSDPRQITGTLSFAANENVKYVRLSGAGQHHFHVAWLSTTGGTEVRYGVVLRANDQRSFERVLEITLGPHSQAVQVTYHVLDVFIDALA